MNALRPAPGVIRSYLLVTHSHYPDDPRAVKHALAVREAGYEVTVICLRRRAERRRETIDGVRIERLPLEHRRGGAGRYLFEYVAIFLLATGALARRAVSRPPSVVQVNTPPDLLVFAALAPKLRGSRLILDLHEPMPELFASIRRLDSRSWLVRALAAAERASTRFADGVMTVSEVCRSTFAGRGTPTEKITVVKNVCDTTLFDPERVTGAGEPRDEGDFRLVYHGTLVPRYGVDLVLRAMAKLRERIPGIRLAIYGRGEASEGLARLARELGIEDRVKLAGQVPLSEIPARIAGADVGVVPNRSDLFMDLVLPTKLFEYLAMGKPVVVSRTRAVLDYFGEEDLYLFDPEDVDGLAEAIARVRSAPAEARDRAGRLRRRAAAETWEAEKGKLVALVRSLAPDEPGPS